jgi:hypothetical protein
VLFFFIWSCSELCQTCPKTKGKPCYTQNGFGSGYSGGAVFSGGAGAVLRECLAKWILLAVKEGEISIVFFLFFFIYFIFFFTFFFTFFLIFSALSSSLSANQRPA